MNAKFGVELDGITEDHFRDVEGLSGGAEVLDYDESKSGSKPMAGRPHRRWWHFWRPRRRSVKGK